MERPGNRWFHSIPVLIALALGLIYGYGALTLYGQIKGAGVNAVQAMGLVPVEQILSRGIGSIVSELGQMLVALLFALPAFWVAPKEAQNLRARLRSSRPFYVVFGCFFLLLALSSPMKEAIVVSIAVLVAAGTAAGMNWITRQRGEEGVRAAWLTAFVTGAAIILALNIGNAFVRPAPLPHAELTMRKSGHSRGGLITVSGGFWYLAGSNGNVEAVPSHEVMSSEISYRKRAAEQSVLDWALDRPPSTLLGKDREE